MVESAAQVREALGDPQLSLDSPPRLLRALHRAEIDVESTSKWELTRYDHPAIEPLLRYKKQSRLLAANGWAWLDEWVHEGRYRPVYVPGGVVTGRWASSGGGALQIPRQLRPALRADEGWRLVSADVAQLEPRVLAAMSADTAMATAGAGKDLYSGIVDAGIVASRQEAKVGVLGALYGGTTGDSGRVVPRLRRTFPDAMALVDGAAATGERGGTVSTWLGLFLPRSRGGLDAGPDQCVPPRSVLRRAGAGATLRARSWPLHPQLRRPGHGCGMGAVLARGAETRAGALRTGGPRGRGTRLGPRVRAPCAPRVLPPRRGDRACAG